MSDSFEDQDWVRVGVAGALQNEYNRDQRDFLRLLAQTLESALPQDTEITKRGFISKTLAAVSVSLGDYKYTLEDPGKGPLLAKRMKIVRGIALKTEELPVSEFLTELTEAIEARLGKSAEARAALSHLLGLP